MLLTEFFSSLRGKTLRGADSKFNMDEGRPCRALISSHSSKPFELGGCIRHPASTGRHWRSILPQMEVSLSSQDMSQPATTTLSTAASAVTIAAISLHGIGQDFTGGVPRLPRWQPAHTTGGWCSRSSKHEAASLPRPASASVLMAQLACSLSSKLPGSGSGSRADSVELAVSTFMVRPQSY